MKKITRKKLVSFLVRYASDKKILDIGAGASVYDKFFPNRITFDIDKKRKPDIIGDAHHLPFVDNSFPMIICTEVLEHLINPSLAIDEMNRVLQPGGLLILTTRFIFPLHDAPGDYWRFTEYGLRQLFASWEVVELIPESQSFTSLAILLQRMIFQINFKFNYLVKLCLLLLVNLFSNLNFLIKDEYGDILKSSPENNIFSTGYYLVVKKITL